MGRWRLRLWLGSAAVGASMALGCGHVSKHCSSCGVMHSTHDSSPVQVGSGCTSCGSSMAHGGHGEHGESYIEHGEHGESYMEHGAPSEPQMAMPQGGMMMDSMPAQAMPNYGPSTTIRNPQPIETMISPTPTRNQNKPPLNEILDAPNAGQAPPVLPMPTIGKSPMRPTTSTTTPLPDKTADNQGWKTSTGIRPVSSTERTSSVEPTTDTVRVSYNEPTPLTKLLFDRSRDYSMLVGTLEQGRQEGTWCVRFCPLDEEDRFGGSVTLTNVGDTSNFAHGQWVRIEGELLNPDNSRSKPNYKVRSMSLVK